MGPRDWLPPTSVYQQDYRTRRQRSLLLDDRCRGGTSALLLAVLSLIFGVLALACAVAPSFPAVTGVRWVLTTVGVSAVLTGTDAMRRSGGRASLLIKALGTVGIGTGVIATGAMLMTFAGATSFNPVQPVPQAITDSAASGERPARPDAQPPVPAPAAAVPSLGQMEQSVGTLAYLMKREHRAGTPWPAVLQVSPDGVVTAPGMPGVVLRLPVGTRLGYRTSTDGTAFAVRLSSTGESGRYVDYDTNSGVVTADSSGS